MIFESAISKSSASTTCIVLKGPTGCGKSFLFDKLIQKFEKDVRISDIDSLPPTSSNDESEYFNPESSFKCGNSLFPSLSFSTFKTETTATKQVQADQRKVLLRLTDAHFLQSIGLERGECSQIRRAIELLKTHSGILLIEVTDFEFEGSNLQGYILKVLKETFPKSYHLISLNSSTSTIIKKTLEPFKNSSNIPLADFIEEFNGDSRAFLHDLYAISLIPKLKRIDSLRDFRTDFFHYVGKLLYVSKSGSKIFDEVSFWGIDFNLYLTFLQFYFPKFCPDLKLISMFLDQLCEYDIIPWKVLKHVSIENHLNACKYSPLLTCFHFINDPKTPKSTQKFFSFTRPPLIEEGSSEIRKKCRKIGICPEDLYVFSVNVNKM